MYGTIFLHGEKKQKIDLQVERCESLACSSNVKLFINPTSFPSRG